MTADSINIEPHRETYERIVALIAPFNRKGVEITPTTTFAIDLDLDSLTVMDLVAAIEDEFDIVIPLNRLPDLETVAEVAAAVDEIREKGR
ncbi:MAG: acyl carrier protein [Alphaproteobacteria bacterium]|nr:MAG: acyl carrier protein [Alphaproteobacteria bacterium]